MSWLDIPTLATGQVLSAEYFNKVLANVDYVFSLESFGACAFRVVDFGNNVPETATGVWTGYFLHWSASLGYTFYVNAFTTGAQIVIQVDTSGPALSGTWATVATVAVGATGLLQGNAPLTGLGLIKGTVYHLRVNVTACAGEVQYLIHYGNLGSANGNASYPAYDWQAPPAGWPAAGATITTADLNNFLRNNVLYLRDQLAGPWTPTDAAVGVSMTVTNESDINAMTSAARLLYQGAVGWKGYLNHRADPIALQIGAWPTGSGDVDSDPVCVAYDYAVLGTLRTQFGFSSFTYDGEFLDAGWVQGQVPPKAVGERSLALSQVVIDSGSTDLATAQAASTLAFTGAHALVHGNWYELRLLRRRTGTNGDNQGGHVGALQFINEVNGVPSTAGWNTLAPFAGESYLDSTAGQPLALLAANILTLKGRVDNYPFLVCRESANEKYTYRRGDLLFYGPPVDPTKPIDLYYIQSRVPVQGAASTKVTLPNPPAGTTAVLDLGSLGGLVYGGLYWVVNVAFTLESLA